MHSHSSLARAPAGCCPRPVRRKARTTRPGAITAFQTGSDATHVHSTRQLKNQDLLAFDPEAWARSLPWPSSSQLRWTTPGFRSLSTTCYIIAQTPSYRALTLGDKEHLLAFPHEADAAVLLEHLDGRRHDGAFADARPTLSRAVSRLSKDHAVCRDDVQDLCWWAMRHGKRVCIVDRVTYADGHVQVTGRPARDTGLVAFRARPILSGRIHTDGDRAGQVGPIDG